MSQVAVDVKALDREAHDRITRTKTQVFFGGGHGGAVWYDGEGGAMEKEGGPMDRVYVLRNEGELAGNHGLDITYGAIEIRTGRLLKEVESVRNEDGDTVHLYTFDENPSETAVVIRGGIPEIGLPNDSELFTGSVEASEMQWICGDATGKLPELPYTAYHMQFKVHPQLLKRFGIVDPEPLIAVSGWCKIINVPIVSHTSPTDIGPTGQPFKTQQHLGSLRIFFA